CGGDGSQSKSCAIHRLQGKVLGPGFSGFVLALLHHKNLYTVVPAKRAKRAQSRDPVVTELTRGCGVLGPGSSRHSASKTRVYALMALGRDDRKRCGARNLVTQCSYSLARSTSSLSCPQIP